MKRKRCIFTSAGDVSNVLQWRSAATAEAWDLITVFYGDDPSEYRALAEASSVCLRRKGSKFQNLKAIRDEHPELLDGYDSIWVCDDDVLMSPSQTIDAFALFERLGLWVAQPAFDRRGKAPHAITITQYPQCDLRLVTFLEMTCPIFRADKLFDFMDVYDPRVIGWGTDYWFCHHFKSEQNWRLAIMDCITVTNPLPEQRRGGQREILKLASNADREAQWRTVQRERAIPDIRQRTLAKLKL
jgi:hypothetical protein